MIGQWQDTPDRRRTCWYVQSPVRLSCTDSSKLSTSSLVMAKIILISQHGIKTWNQQTTRWASYYLQPSAWNNLILYINQSGPTSLLCSALSLLKVKAPLQNTISCNTPAIVIEFFAKNKLNFLRVDWGSGSIPYILKKGPGRGGGGGDSSMSQWSKSQPLSSQ